MKTEKFTIKDIWGEDLATVEIEIAKGDGDNSKLGKAVLVAIEEKANLSSANLSYADLSYADLSSANLSYANLSYANLRYADLSYADLSSANLRYANLSYANLSYANLRYANLSYADLSSANLSEFKMWGATGNCREIKSMQIETYSVSYTAEFMQIGCEQHALEEWKDFDDKRILEMEGKEALRFWQKFKGLIFKTIELSPAVKSEYKEVEADASN